MQGCSKYTRYTYIHNITLFPWLGSTNVCCIYMNVVQIECILGSPAICMYATHSGLYWLHGGIHSMGRTDTRLDISHLGCLKTGRRVLDIWTAWCHLYVGHHPVNRYIHTYLSLLQLSKNNTSYSVFCSKHMYNKYKLATIQINYSHMCYASYDSRKYANIRIFINTYNICMYVCIVHVYLFIHTILWFTK